MSGLENIEPAITRQLKASGITWDDAHAAARARGLSWRPSQWTMGELADIINHATGAADNTETEEV